MCPSLRMLSNTHLTPRPYSAKNSIARSPSLRRYLRSLNRNMDPNQMISAKTAS